MKVIPIVMFHRIAECKATDTHNLCVNPSIFAAQMEFLAQQGWTLTSLEGAIGARRRGCEGKLLAVTFDDGFADVVDNALPVLSRLRGSATCFLVAGKIGASADWDVAGPTAGARLMGNDDVNAWLASGMRIGSHTMTHRNMKGIAPAEREWECRGSREALAERFQVPIETFAYPFGGYDSHIMSAVASSGYRAAVTVRPGVSTELDSHVEFRRIHVSQMDTPRRLLRRIQWHVGLARIRNGWR